MYITGLFDISYLERYNMCDITFTYIFNLSVLHISICSYFRICFFYVVDLHICLLKCIIYLLCAIFDE